MAIENIAVVVEDDLSLAVIEQVVMQSHQSIHIARALVERGFGNIKRSMGKYRNASNVIPHVILTDLDQEDCPIALRRAWGCEDLPNTLIFRVAVREVEAWLLGDSEAFASFAGIPPTKVPTAPESLPDPKQVLINLIRRSRNRRLAAEIVPSQGSRVPIGPLYNERLCGFVRGQWRARVAAQRCESLARTIDSLKRYGSGLAA
jgi:hypothetical protein